MSDQEHENEEERLHLRLPKGLKKNWKDKATKRGFSSIWTYLKDLVENDLGENELTNEGMKTLSRMAADNELQRKKMDLLLQKIEVLENNLETKTIMRDLISEKLTQKILNYIGPGRKTSEIANHLNQDEFLTLGMLDTLEGLGKVTLNTKKGVWELIE